MLQQGVHVPILPRQGGDPHGKQKRGDGTYMRAVRHASTRASHLPELSLPVRQVYVPRMQLIRRRGQESVSLRWLRDMQGRRSRPIFPLCQVQHVFAGSVTKRAHGT